MLRVVLHDWHIEEREYLRQEERSGRRHGFEHLDPARTALLVADLVAFFIDENEYARGIVPNVNAVAGSLRGAGGTVAWIVPGDRQPSAMKDELLGPRIAELYSHSGGEGPPRERVWHELDSVDGDVFADNTTSRFLK